MPTVVEDDRQGWFDKWVAVSARPWIERSSAVHRFCTSVRHSNRHYLLVPDISGRGENTPSFQRLCLPNRH